MKLTGFRIRNLKIISLAAFSSLGLIGLLFTSVGTSLPLIQRYFDISLSSAGIISSLVQLGYALFCFLGGLLSDRISKSKVLVLGTLFCGLPEILLAYSGNWYLTLILFFLIGMGSGLIFIASNTLIIDLFRNNPGTYLNIHHTFFALGSLSAPLIVSALLTRGYAWFTAFRILGLLTLFICIVFLFSDISARASLSGTKAGGSSPRGIKIYLDILKQKNFIKLLITGFFALGVQFGIIYLMVSFLVKVRMFPQNTASLVMSGFFAFLLIGRLICGYLIKKYPPVKIIETLLLLLTATLIIGWFTSGAVSLVMFALTGLAASGLMPTLLALASTTLAREVRGTALGFLSMAGGLGGMLVTLAVTGFAGYTGFNFSFLLLLIISMGTAVYFLFISRGFTSQ